jgi:serine/threonine-protein kinase RsbW
VVHGYEEAGRTGNLKVASTVENGSLAIVLEDQGPPYDPRRHVHRVPELIERPLHERQVGGLGIFLALDGVDELQYESANGTNRTVFLVRLPGAADPQAPPR